jgi:hypothetical protein
MFSVLLLRLLTSSMQRVLLEIYGGLADDGFGALGSQDTRLFLFEELRV